MSPEADPAPAPVHPAEPACLNCGAAVQQRFCPACGQETGHALQRPVRELIGEVLDETIALDSRFTQSLRPLLFRPGFLTVEHLAGRKARYTSPLKLYLLFSFVFFVVSALTPNPTLQVATSEQRSRVRLATREETQQGLAELRTQGRLGARVADRFQALQALPRAEAAAHVNAVLQENAPRVVFFLVPVLALLLKLLYRRRYYAEHLVTSLHVHAFAFAALLPSELLPWDGVGSGRRGAHRALVRGGAAQDPRPGLVAHRGEGGHRALRLRGDARRHPGGCADDRAAVLLIGRRRRVSAAGPSRPRRWRRPPAGATATVRPAIRCGGRARPRRRRHSRPPARRPR